jgi:glycosyltransferase involved in cell wall biosynthesis
MIHVAIYSYHIYDWFSNDLSKATGGAEFQLFTLSQKLKNNNIIVTFLVGDAPFDGMETSVDGFNFIKLYPQHYSNKIKKYLFIARRLWKCKANVFLERGSSNMTLWLSLISFLKNSRYIFFAASDIDFATDELHPSFTSKFQQRLFHVGLRLASKIVVQKETQKISVWNNFRRSANIIKNFPPAARIKDNVEKEWDVIWVNNIIPYKKPEVVITLAEKLPNIKFLMIGGARNTSYFEDIKAQVLEHSNITFLGFIPYNEVDQYIVKSKLMINTTVVKGKYEEGFPNSFLQAWQLGIPAISLLSNPDNIFEKYSIGICSLTVEKMADDILYLLNDEVKYKNMSASAKAYIGQHHNADSIVQQYLSVIEA